MADDKNKPAEKSAEDKLKEQNANLIARVESLEEKIEVLEGALNESAQSSVTVAAKEEKKDPPKIPGAVKVGGKEVTFKVPAFWYGDEKVLAEDAVKDKALMKELVEKYPGLFA